MIGLVQSGSAAGCDNHRIRLDHIHVVILDAKAERTLNAVVLDEKVCDVHVILDRHLGQGFHCLCQDRFHVFTVDLQIPVATCHILSVFILEDDQPQTFHVLRHLVEPFRHGEQQISTDDAVCILPGIVHIILGLSALGNISIQRIDASRQTAAPLNVRLFTDQHFCIRLLCNGQRRIAACRAAADNQYVCFAAFYFHLITIFFHSAADTVLPMPRSLHRLPQR